LWEYFKGSKRLGGNRVWNMPLTIEPRALIELLHIGFQHIEVHRQGGCVSQHGVLHAVKFEQGFREADELDLFCLEPGRRHKR
jgi:hypothetical protein